MMRSELRGAVRSLRRTPWFALTAITILAVGIGGSTAVFSVINQVLLKPLPYAEPGALVRVYQYDEAEPDENSYVAVPAFSAYRRMQSLESAAALYTYRETGDDLTSDDGAQRVRRLEVSAAYFDVLRARPALGRAFLPEEERARDVRRAVLSYELWRDRFSGARDVIGHTVQLSGASYEIVGVAPRGLKDPVVGAVDVWVPRYLPPDDDPENHSLTVVARLHPGAALETARAELAQVDRVLHEQFPEAADAHGRIVGLHDDTVAGSARMLYVLLGAIGLVLLIVCLDIANLLLARATAREREFAVRAALGSGRGRIVQQLMLESLLLGLIGGVAGVLLGMFLLDAIVALGSSSVPRLADAHFDLRVLLFSGVVSVGSAVLFGMLPAVRYSRTAAAGVLRDNARNVTADRGRNRLRTALVGAQVALAFMLLVGSSILMLSFYRLRNIDLGVSTDNVLTFEVHLPVARYDSVRRALFHEEFATRVRALPGVAAVGGVSRLPVTGSYHGWGSRAATGPLVGTPEANISTEQRVVSGDYFAALQIPLVAGRLLDARDDMRAPQRVVISRAAAQAAFPGVDAIGQSLRILSTNAEVIGVVDDVALTAEGVIVPTAYRAHRQFAGNRNWPLTQVVRANGDPMRVLPAIRAELAALDPQLVLHRPVTFADVLGHGVAQRRFTTWLMTAFAALAVILATLGLFGVITYVVRQRRREMGIRVALGARPAHIRRMVLAQGLRVAGLGIAVGLVGALAASRVLQSLVFETQPADPRVLAAAAIGMAAIAALATYLPAREATAVDPGTVLQEQ